MQQQFKACHSWNSHRNCCCADSVRASVLYVRQLMEINYDSPTGTGTIRMRLRIGPVPKLVVFYYYLPGEIKVSQPTLFGQSSARMCRRNGPPFSISSVIVLVGFFGLSPLVIRVHSIWVILLERATWSNNKIPFDLFRCQYHISEPYLWPHGFISMCQIG